jgi:TRAP-type C4-dicarboxylate transport system permease small subunit
VIAAARIVRICLEAVTVSLLVTLAAVVVLAVIYRYSGASFVWYDEVASVMLAWITYYGAALATMRRSHLGFSGFALSLGRSGRMLLFVLAELVVYAVFVTMAWVSWDVLEVMRGETLVSLDWVPLQFTQSVVPIGCALFVLAQVLTTPEAWARARAGRSAEATEIEQEIKKAQEDLSDGPGARK